MCEVPTFAPGLQIREVLKDELVLIEIACSWGNGRGTVKREAPICARPAAYAASATFLNPALLASLRGPKCAKSLHSLQAPQIREVLKDERVLIEIACSWG